MPQLRHRLAARPQRTKALSTLRIVPLLLSVVGAWSACARTTSQSASQSAGLAWTLVWSDEFDGRAGARPDSTRWRYDIGDGCANANCGWGNEERQTYTSAPENVSQNGEGQLAVVARRAPAGMTCYYGACQYTSSKITTRGLMSAAPGRVEARIKTPSGQGLWPAFWMLGVGYPATPWPQAGHLEVMERRGSEPAVSISAIHGPGYSGGNAFTNRHTLPNGTFSDAYHTFAVEWNSQEVRFFVDSTLHYRVPRADIVRRGAWVFDQSFFINLNLAVGGTFDGQLKSDDVLPATMLVDYVRVYKPRG